jgi:hypothetical protein
MKDLRRREAWDGYPLLTSEMMPGERRRVGFVFLSGAEAAVDLTSQKRFYLCEASIVGEAEIVF